MDQVLIIGIAASVFSAVSLLPQLIKLIKEKEADDISLPMLIILFVGLSFWIWYGVVKKDWVIIVANIISVSLNLLVVFFAVKYRKKSK